MKVVALVPAHNEEATLSDCLRHLCRQTRRPDLVSVILDNCTDGTEAVARRWEDNAQAHDGALQVEVLKTADNRQKKAGALNAALAEILPLLDAGDAVLVVDADSYLDPGFTKEALRWLRGGFAAVGGTFRGRSEGTYVSWCEQSEYLRYARDTARAGGAALTLSGTAMLARVQELRWVALSRVDRDAGRIYSTANLTEDLELSVRIMRLGGEIVAPPACTLTTETMGTWRALLRQRIRWREGAVRTVLEYGWGCGTRELTLRLAWGLLGVGVIGAYLGTMLWALASGGVAIAPFWLAITAVFAAEQAVTVFRRGGWKRAALGALLLPELPYLLFLQAVYGLAYLRSIGSGERGW